MPGKFSRTGGKVALGAVPIDFYVTLATSAPTSESLGDEFVAPGYTRKACRRTFVPTDTDPPTISNADAITFGPLTDARGDEIGWVMAMRGPAGGTYGDMFAFWELDDPRTPEVGDALVLDAGALVLNCS